MACKTHIFTSLPEVFEVTLKIQRGRPDATVESIIDTLKEDERIRMIMTTPDTATEAFHTLTGIWRGVRICLRGGRGRGRDSGNRTWCRLCNTRSHSLEDCWLKDRDVVADNSAEPCPSPLCWHCGGSGHRQAECPVKHRGDEARAGGWKRQKFEEALAQLGERELGPGF